MKNTWIVVAFLFAAVTVSAQETVSSVSFNPSRLGNFEKLKVSGSATLRGGLQTTNLEIGGKANLAITDGTQKVCWPLKEDGSCQCNSWQSTNTGSPCEGTAANGSCNKWCACLHSDSEGNCTEYDYSYAEVAMPVGVSEGGTVTMSSSRPFTLASLSSPVSIVDVSYNGMSMPSATFRQTNTLGHGYQFTSNSYPTGTIPVEVKGGTLDFSGLSAGDSFINRLVANNNLIASARKMSISGTLEVAKTAADYAQLVYLVGGETIQGFELGNIVIPPPVRDNMQFTATMASSYTASPGLDLTKCDLKWIKRKVNDSGVTPRAEYVLGFGDKADGTQCKPICQDGTVGRDTLPADCPSGSHGYAYYNILRQIHCVNGEPQEHVMYIKADGSLSDTPTNLNTSGCEQDPSWKWVYQGKADNDYVSRWVWWNEGWTGIFGGYHPGLQTDTKCTLLSFGDAASFPIGMSNNGVVVSLGASKMQRKNQLPSGAGRTALNDMIRADISVSYAGSGVNFVDFVVGVAGHMRTENIPECNSSRNGEERWVENVVLVPKVFGVWPGTCNSIGKKYKYKCLYQ